LKGRIGLSINLNLSRCDFVFPWPETTAVNSDVIGIPNFSLLYCWEERPAKRSFVGAFPLFLPVCVRASACVRGGGEREGERGACIGVSH
jgi:hypothetical protein